MDDRRAPIAEIFDSIDGEINFCGQGTISRFIRVAGCNLRCPYCDTAITQSSEGFPKYSVDEMLSRKLLFPSSPSLVKFTITGGEPLLYPKFLCDLLILLNRLGYHASVETNGTLSIFGGMNCGWVIDSKAPSSGSSGRFLYKNLAVMDPNKDAIKMVLATKEDLIWAISETRFLSVGDPKGIPIAWGCVEGGELTPQDLLVCLIENDLAYVKINAQLHKYLKLK